MTRNLRALPIAVALLAVAAPQAAATTPHAAATGPQAAATAPHAPGSAAPPADTPENAPQQQVRVVLEDVAPTAPGPESTLRVTGHLAAVDTRLTDLSVRLRYSSRPFVSRGAMGVYADGGGRPGTRPAPGSDVELDGDRGSSGSPPFSLRVPVRELGLQEFGVYPIAVEVLSGEQQVALQRTLLPYVPDGGSNTQPTRAAWVWPLVDRPHRGTDDVFIDDKLDGALAQGGRLRRLLDAAQTAADGGDGSGVPLLWALDPALLQSAQDMADGYRVQSLDSGESTEQDPNAGARQWLDDLRAEIRGQQVVSLPYADPDVMALHRAGLDENLGTAISRSPEVTSEILGRNVLGDVIWPPGGWLNQDTLDTLAGMGARRVILNERSLPPAQPLTYTPGATAATPTVGGTVRALVADSTVTRILAGATAAPGSATLAEQRFLAETALITDELPNRARTLLIAPPRRWDPPPGFAAALLQDTARAPWLEPVGLSHLQQQSPSVERAAPHYPRSARARELSQRYLAEVREMQVDTVRLNALLGQGASQFGGAVLRTESSAWRALPTVSRQLRETVRNSLESRRGKVHVVARGRLLLASDSGTVPISIANDLADRTVTVQLDIRPRNSARLHVGDYRRRVQIEPESKATVKVPMTAVTSGVADLYVQLHTPEGKAYGDPVLMKVRATGYGTAALVITAGALAVLFLGVAARVVRRALRAGSGDGPPAEPAEPADQAGQAQPASGPEGADQAEEGPR